MTEGGLAPVSCLEISPNPCQRAATCSTLGFWEELHECITNFIDGVSLEDLVKKELSRLEGGSKGSKKVV